MVARAVAMEEAVTVAAELAWWVARAAARAAGGGGSAASTSPLDRLSTMCSEWTARDAYNKCTGLLRGRVCVGRSKLASDVIVSFRPPFLLVSHVHVQHYVESSFVCASL